MQRSLAIGCQRWRERRDSYRPPRETIRTAEYGVGPLDERLAKQFVITHHYARSYPAARFRFGLFRRGDLVGVAVYSHPVNDRVLTGTFPTLSTRASVELGRLVLLDEVPGNGETWFLARTFELLRGAAIRGVVSFSDPVPRTALDGTLVRLGHYGCCYQSHNAKYLGRGTPSTLRLLPDGISFNHRSAQKIRAGERGWRGAAAQLVAYGAPDLPENADRAERATWLAEWMAALTRPLRHPGNHRYAWALDRRVSLAAGLPYPKPLRSAA